MSPDVQREVEEVFPLYSEGSMCQYFLSQSYGYYIHIIPEVCSEFHVVDVGFVMALLQRDYSYRYHLIIQELVLETSLVP